MNFATTFGPDVKDNVGSDIVTMLPQPWSVCRIVCFSPEDRQKDRHTDTQTHRQADRPKLMYIPPLITGFML